MATRYERSTVATCDSCTTRPHVHCRVFRPRRSTARPSERDLDLRHLRRLAGFVRPYATPLVWGILAVVVAGGLQLAFPLLVRDLFNEAFVAEIESSAGLNGIILLLVAIFAVQAVFNFVRTYLLGVVGEGVVADLRKAVFSHLIGLPVAFFEERKTGEITSRLTSDVGTLQNLVSTALANFVNQLILLVGGAVVLFVINARLTLLMLAVVPAVIVAGAFFGRRLRKISMDFQDRVAEANASAEEAIQGIRVVKTFTAEKKESTRYAEQIDASFAVGRRRAMIRAIFIPSIIMAMFIGISVVLWYGGRQVVQGALLPGDLIAFLFLTIFIAGSVASFTGLYSQVQEAIGASKRIFELLESSGDVPEPLEPVVLGSVEGRVRFDGVSFRYHDREERVLEDIELEARPGEVIALVGPSGAGKSTLVTLLPRFYDPTAGRVLLDGVDLRDVSLDELRRNIGVVPQETQLFSGTILDNILYGRPAASRADVVAAARAANADDFVRAFPEGYETIVGERGLKLSGGQRQRIAIARALLKNPRILVLDEATSSLDSESEALVQAALEHLMTGRTTFVIAHRLSTVVGADRIVVLDGGRIVEQGSHAELYAFGGLYRSLYARQFQATEAVAG